MIIIMKQSLNWLRGQEIERQWFDCPSSLVTWLTAKIDQRRPSASLINCLMAFNATSLHAKKFSVKWDPDWSAWIFQTSESRIDHDFFDWAHFNFFLSLSRWCGGPRKAKDCFKKRETQKTHVKDEKDVVCLHRNPSRRYKRMANFEQLDALRSQGWMDAPQGNHVSTQIKNSSLVQLWANLWASTFIILPPVCLYVCDCVWRAQPWKKLRETAPWGNEELTNWQTYNPLSPSITRWWNAVPVFFPGFVSQPSKESERNIGNMISFKKIGRRGFGSKKMHKFFWGKIWTKYWQKGFFESFSVTSFFVFLIHNFYLQFFSTCLISNISVALYTMAPSVPDIYHGPQDLMMMQPPVGHVSWFEIKIDHLSLRTYTYQLNRRWNQVRMRGKKQSSVKMMRGWYQW